jgi:molybdopterin-containing oxidoreductase family iron-sulfur binding subunit
LSEEQPKRYWKSPEERDADPAFLQAAAGEFPPGLVELGAEGMPRRDFLKAAGFTLALTFAAGCSRAPVEKAIPMLVQPEGFVPGKSVYYASTCGGCSAGCGVLVKVRDGRPIKLEGNPQHPLSRGGLCAVGQASILGLYDAQRLRGPLRQGREASWDEVDNEIKAELQTLRAQRGAVRFLSGPVISPTLRASIAEFLKAFAGAQHVVYSPLSQSAILDAHAATHGARVMPRYRFDRAEVVAGFDADFLGTWISPVEYTAGYRAQRALEAAPPRFSLHVQFEPRMSLTGAKADYRFRVRPSEMGDVLQNLAYRIARLAGEKFDAPSAAVPAFESEMNALAQRLWAARGRSLVVCGVNGRREQLLVNYINHLLGNYGATIELEAPSAQAQGDDAALADLLAELRDGRVHALFVLGADPLFDLPEREALAQGLAQVPLLVSFAQRLDDTAVVARYVCPDHHFLESWSDAEPVAGVMSVTQPVIRPLGHTRAVVESLAAWSGRAADAHTMQRAYWHKAVYPRAQKKAPFDDFWNTAVHDGVTELAPARTTIRSFNRNPVLAVRARSGNHAGGLELLLYPKAAMLDGRHAYNPWLHELPDPVSKVAWDNYACLAPATAERLSLEQGQLIRIEAPGAPALELPVFIQPGQHESVIAVALGYGSRLSARFAGIGPRWLHARPSVGEAGVVGVNAAPLLQLAAGALQSWRADVRLTPLARRHDLASTQHHHSLTVPAKLAPPEGARRPILQETTLAAFMADPSAGVEEHPPEADLWGEHAYPGHRWGMVVDLSACTGCSGCVIACQAENNVPVVGQDEVRRHREMHWIRIDRYYAESEAGVDVAFQPMFCQHCGNAPCETVCPVLATVHSSEGLNEQVYNRCIGTRYCANNCPYKGRRFNWFDYAREDKLQNLVLNPDVTVRSRGVMEKCTFCVQRIQEAKFEAGRRGVPLADGDIQPACQQSCPAQAIVFGDLNDPASRVAQLMRNPRRYRILAELNVRPAVGYLTLVRNRPAQEKERHG